MTPQRWQRINDLFTQALGQPAGDRTAFLDRACAAEPSLRGEVERLLEQDEEAARDGFLAMPSTVPESPCVAQPDRLTGRRVGPYEVREWVGGGGMGDVYRAVRVDDYRQEVALKVVKPGLGGEEFKS